MTEQGPLSGQKIGEKYQLGDLLGEGAFGAVYKAQHLQLHRQQAIKVLLEQHFRKSEFRDRFFREAQTGYHATLLPAHLERDGESCSEQHANADFAHENGSAFLLPKSKQVSRCMNTSFIPLAHRLRKYDRR